MRLCSKCGESKPLSDFYRDKAYADGLKKSCKACDIDAGLKRYHANPEEWKARHKSWVGRNREKLRAYWRNRPRKSRPRGKERERVHRLKRRAKGNVTKGFLGWLLRKQRGLCVVCRVGLKAKFHVDHILPIALGGTSDRGNLQLLCAPCNIAKGARHPVAFMQSRGLLL